jgi:hypothetical protein
MGYPSVGSLIYRPSTQIVARFLELFFASEVKGDTLCMLIQKQN